MAIQASIGLNTSPFMKGAQEVKAATERMMKDAGAAARKHAAAGGKEFGSLKGEKSVLKGITGIGHGLSHADNAAEALTASLEKVGRIFHLGLPVALAAAFGAALISSVEKINKAFDECAEKSANLVATNQRAIDFGGAADQDVALKETAKALEEINKQLKVRASLKGHLAHFWNDVTGGQDKMSDMLRNKSELETQQPELVRARVNDLQIEAEIAELKRDGRNQEAQAMELSIKKKKELLALEKSALKGDDLANAESAIERKYAALGDTEKRNKVDEASKAYGRAVKAGVLQSESIGDTDDEKRVRAAQRIVELSKEALALNQSGDMIGYYEKSTELLKVRNDLLRMQVKDEREITETLAKRALIGESEVQKIVRLNAEVEKYKRLMDFHNQAGNRTEATHDRAEMERRKTELAELEHRRAKTREDSVPGLMQSAYALAAAATGDKGIVSDVDRRTRYSNHLSRLTKEGYSEDDAKRLAANQTRLEDLKKLQEGQDRGQAGRADANRRLGLGGYAERGTDAASIGRQGNVYLSEIKALIADQTAIIAKQKPAAPKAGAAFQ